MSLVDNVDIKKGNSWFSGKSIKLNKEYMNG